MIPIVGHYYRIDTGRWHMGEKVILTRRCRCYVEGGWVFHDGEEMWFPREIVLSEVKPTIWDRLFRR